MASDVVKTLAYAYNSTNPTTATYTVPASTTAVVRRIYNSSQVSSQAQIPTLTLNGFTLTNTGYPDIGFNPVGSRLIAVNFILVAGDVFTASQAHTGGAGNEMVIVIVGVEIT